MRAIADREGLDLDRCSAYSDSANDIPMLSLVGHPFAINPDPLLRAHARANYWPIRDFRRREKVRRIAVPALAGGVGIGLGISAGFAVGRLVRR